MYTKIERKPVDGLAPCLTAEAAMRAIEFARTRLVILRPALSAARRAGTEPADGTYAIRAKLRRCFASLSMTMFVFRSAEVVAKAGANPRYLRSNRPTAEFSTRKSAPVAEVKRNLSE